MSSHPVNLALRFLLEIAALVAIGFWGWDQATGPARLFLAVGAPLIAAGLWGVFRVPGDASASGRALVPVPGMVRLLVELGLFAFAVWVLYNRGATTLWVALSALVLLHYLTSYDRLAWLVRQ